MYGDNRKILDNKLIAIYINLTNRMFAGSWDDVFKVAVILYLIGTLVWNLFSTGEKILD